MVLPAVRFMEHYKPQKNYINRALVVLLYNYLLMPNRTQTAALLLLFALSAYCQLSKCPL